MKIAFFKNKKLVLFMENYEPHTYRKTPTSAIMKNSNFGSYRDP